MEPLFKYSYIPEDILIRPETQRSVLIGLEGSVGDELVPQIDHLAHVSIRDELVHERLDTDQIGDLAAVLNAHAHDERQRPEQELKDARQAKVVQVDQAKEPGDGRVRECEKGSEGDQVG